MHVSMYYLTQTFDSAAFIYAQNPTGKGFSYTYRRARSNQPLLYSNFQWNMLFYPEKLVATVGNLVYYNCESDTTREINDTMSDLEHIADIFVSG